MSPPELQRIGSYRVVRELGRGRAWVTYECVHAHSHRRTVLKVLAAACGGRFRYFLDGDRVLRMLRHPGIVTASDTGELPDGRPYIVTDRVEGESLAHRMAQAGVLTLPNAIGIAWQLADALAEAHSRQIRHGALRADKVRLLAGSTGEWEATRLLGLGLESLIRASVDSSSLSGDEQECADVRALGALVHEMLVGKPPPEQAPPPDLCDLNPLVPRSLSALIQQMLALDPRERPVMERVAHTLWHLAGEPPALKRPSPALHGREPGGEVQASIIMGSPLVVAGACEITVGPRTSGSVDSSSVTEMSMGSSLLPPPRPEQERIEGWLGVDAPQEMAVGSAAVVRAVAIRDVLQKLLLEQALTQPTQQIAQERLAPRVRMELIPLDEDDFAVRALSPVEQPVQADELTVWEWLITARSAGNTQQLLLTVTNLLDDERRPLSKSLPSRRIEILVTPGAQPASLLFTLDGLRKILRETARSDEEFEGLCAKHFPAAHARFAEGMGRERKTDLLLLHEPSRAIVDTLRMHYPEPFAAHAPAHALVPPEQDASPRPRRSFGARLLPSSFGEYVLVALLFGLLIYVGGGLIHSVTRPRPARPPSRALKPLGETGIGAETVPRGKDYAVLFATTRYEDRLWPQLKTPSRDARAIADDLRTLYGFGIETVEDPSVAELRRRIRELAARKYGAGDQLFLFFAGHGDKDETLKKGWIIARDSRAQERESAYPYSELREDIDRIPCRHILLVLDVCFGGSFDPSLREAQTRGRDYEEASPEEFIGRKLRTRSRLYVSSVDQKTEAPEGGEHSPFAWKFLEALRSGGGADGVLTWNELVGYLEKLTPEPRGGVFPRSPNSDPGGDFLFVRKRPDAR